MPIVMMKMSGIWRDEQSDYDRDGSDEGGGGGGDANLACPCLCRFGEAIAPGAARKGKEKGVRKCDSAPMKVHTPHLLGLPEGGPSPPGSDWVAVLSYPSIHPPTQLPIHFPSKRGSAM